MEEEWPLRRLKDVHGEEVSEKRWWKSELILMPLLSLRVSDHVHGGRGEPWRLEGEPRASRVF